MLRRNLKGLSFFILLWFAFTLVAPGSVEAAITGNNSSGTAHQMGYWKYGSTDTTILPEGKNDAYYQFTVRKGERVYVTSSYQNQYSGMQIEVNNLLSSDTGTNVINPNSISPFIFAKTADVSSTSETVYVKVSRGTYTGNMYFTVSIKDRIKSGSGKFSFTGTAKNTGNTSLSFAGVDSSVITMDLTNTSTIPDGAVVKSISTSSTQRPSQGNVTHKLMSNQNSVWNTAVVNSATSGSYNISLQDQLLVKKKWSFKYNAKATAKSTMTNVSANINYEYDLTDQF